MDRRPRNLLDEISLSEFASLYNSLVLAADDDSFGIGDIQKIKVSTLLNAIQSSLTDLGDDKADKTNVLLKDNTDEYTPSGDYQPATKKMVDAIGFEVVSRAKIYDNGNIEAQSGITIQSVRYATGAYTITHNLNTSNYMVIPNVTSNSTSYNTVSPSGIYYQSNSFSITLSDDSSANNSNFEFIIIKFNQNFYS